MNIIQEKNKITIHDIKDFDANHILNAANASGGIRKKTGLIREWSKIRL